MTGYPQLTTTDPEECCHRDSGHERLKKTESNIWVEALVIVFAVVLWGVPIYAIPSIELLYRWGTEAPVQEVGSVQKTTYLSGLKGRTQIDTAATNFVLRGNVNLEPDSILILREGVFSDEICVKESDRCWVVIKN